MVKTEEKIVCQGCLKQFVESQMFLVNKHTHCIFSCEKCSKTEYKEFSSIPYLMSNKMNKTKESYTKTALTKDNKKLKIGQTYKGIEINSIKKISKTSDYNKKTKEIITEVKFFISENKNEWIEI